MSLFLKTVYLAVHKPWTQKHIAILETPKECEQLNLQTSFSFVTKFFSV